MNFEFINGFALFPTAEEIVIASNKQNLYIISVLTFVNMQNTNKQNINMPLQNWTFLY